MALLYQQAGCGDAGGQAGPDGGQGLQHRCNQMKSINLFILGLVLSVPAWSAVLVLTDAQADSQANAITHPGKVGQRGTLADYPNYGKSAKSCKSKKTKKSKKGCDISPII